MPVSIVIASFGVGCGTLSIFCVILLMMVSIF